MALRDAVVNLKYLDWLMLAAVTLLSCIGIAALYGIATSREVPDFTTLLKQLGFMGLGLLAMATFSVIDYRRLQAYAWPAAAIGVALLAAVLMFGTSLRGTRGWFSVGIFTFQPVEVAKLSLLILLAKVFSDRAQPIGDRRLVLTSGALVGVFVILTLLQPDFGSSLMLLSMWALMLFISAVPWRTLLFLLGSLAAIFIFAWMFLFADFQRQRILTFLNPGLDPYGRGYHVRQAITAVGSGQMLGRGLGFGSQTQLRFIPAAHTDFIFAVIAEELGFIGAVAVLACFGVLFWRLLVLTRRASDDFGLYLVSGAGGLLFVQFLVNVGMNVGLLPVTGVSLPFVSAGGSFLVAAMALLGIVQSVAIRNVKYRV